MNRLELLQKIKKVLKMAEETPEYKAVTNKLTTDEVITYDIIEEGAVVLYVEEDGTLSSMPEGDYETEDGITFTIGMDSIITAFVIPAEEETPAEETETPVEAAEEEVVEETPAEETSTMTEATLRDGSIIKYESLELGSIVYLVDGENEVALPAGYYEIVDGENVISFSINEEGVIADLYTYTSGDEVFSRISAMTEVEVKLEKMESDINDMLSIIENMSTRFTKIEESPAGDPLEFSKTKTKETKQDKSLYEQRVENLRILKKLKQ